MIQVIYLGPSIDGVVEKNKIFKYNPKDVIEKAKEVNPLAEHLFVSMDKIVEKKKELNKKGSLISMAYKSLKED